MISSRCSGCSLVRVKSSSAIRSWSVVLSALNAMMAFAKATALLAALPGARARGAMILVVEITQRRMAKSGWPEHPSGLGWMH